MKETFLSTHLVVAFDIAIIISKFQYGSKHIFFKCYASSLIISLFTS
jgi:hypothetical protein